MLVGSVWTMTKLFAQPLERHLEQLDRRINRLEGRMTEGFAQIHEDIRSLGTPPPPDHPGFALLEPRTAQRE